MTDRVIDQLEAYGAYADHAAPVVTLDEIEQRVASKPPSRVRVFRPLPGWAIAAAAALALLVAVGSLSLVFGGSDGSVPPADEMTPTSIAPATPTTTAEESQNPPPTAAVPVAPTTFETVTPQGGWSPILADTIARSTEPTATCPTNAESGAAVPSGMPRPNPAWRGNLSGAFDQSTGHIVYVDASSTTWLFDVCTNTWRDANAGGAAGEGWAVYDADSDVTVVMGFGKISVFDATSNSWESRYWPYDQAHELSTGGGPMGAVYDPVSGLILTTFMASEPRDSWLLRAYDVETHRWTEVGQISVERNTSCCTQIDLLGYSPDLDRLILTTRIDDTPTTLLVDPRNGNMTIIPDELAPPVDLGWPDHAFGQADDTVFVYDPHLAGGLLGFDTTTLAWTVHDRPDQIPSNYHAFGAIVDDPINNRVILMHGIHGNWWSAATDDIWSFNPIAEIWTLLQEPRN